MTTEATPRTREEVVAELNRLRDEIPAAEARTKALYDRRRDLFLAGRRLDPKMTMQDLAGEAGITDARVTQEVKKGNA